MKQRLIRMTSDFVQYVRGARGIRVLEVAKSLVLAVLCFVSRKHKIVNIFITSP